MTHSAFLGSLILAAASGITVGVAAFETETICIDDAPLQSLSQLDSSGSVSAEPLESRSDCLQRCSSDYSRCVNQGCQGSSSHGACMQSCFSQKQACEKSCG